MGLMTPPPATRSGHTRTKKRRTPAPTITAGDHRVILARRLDVLADAELQHGHHATAERLAWRAAALRQAAT